VGCLIVRYDIFVISVTTSANDKLKHDIWWLQLPNTEHPNFKASFDRPGTGVDTFHDLITATVLKNASAVVESFAEHGHDKVAVENVFV